MMEAHNMAFRELLYEFPCVILKTVLVQMDRTERVLKTDYPVVKGAMEKMFWDTVAGILLGSKSLRGA